MNRLITKIILLFFILTFLFSSFTGCGKSENQTDNASKMTQNKPTTLEFYLPTQVFDNEGIKNVLDEFYKQTKNTLNVNINFNFTSVDEIGDMVALKLGAGEPIDSIFSAQWTSPNIMEMVSKGQLVELDKYFKDKKNQGLQFAFPQEYLQNNLFTDSMGEPHIYGIPFAHGYDGGSVIYFRKDLSDKYGINNIESLDELTNYFDKILKYEKGVVPFSILGTQDEVSDYIYQILQPLTSEHNYDLNVSGIIDAAVAIRPDGTAYVARKVNYWSDNEFKKLLPEPLNSMDSMIGYKMAREWYTKGYVEKDILSQKDSRGQFMSGKAASFASTLDQYVNIRNQLRDNSSKAELSYFVISQALRSGRSKELPSDLKAWNFACIPVTSKNADKTMEFYNWLFSSKKNHDLFEYGVEGVHWEAQGDSNYKCISGLKEFEAYNFPAYALTWNPSMIRFEQGAPVEVIRTLQNLANTEYFYKKPTIGFSFVTDNVKSEIAKLNDLALKKRVVGNGVVANVSQYLEDLQIQYENAGYLKVQTELEKQLNEFLKK